MKEFALPKARPQKRRQESRIYCFQKDQFAVKSAKSDPAISFCFDPNAELFATSSSVVFLWFRARKIPTYLYFMLAASMEVFSVTSFLKQIFYFTPNL